MGILPMSFPSTLVHRATRLALTLPPSASLRKRLLPGAREHGEAFAFVRFGGPPTNNHAGRRARSAPCGRS